MYVENDAEVSHCIKELTREIWITIRMVLKAEATKDEISSAAHRAKFLRLYIDIYRVKDYDFLTDTELWLAQEVADAVEDLID